MVPTTFASQVGLVFLACAALSSPLAAQESPPGKKSGEKSAKGGDSRTKVKEKPAVPPPAKVPRILSQRVSKTSVLVKEGGNKATEEAVSKALDWLARHQGSGGGWQAADFVEQCKTPCKNKKAGSDGDGIGSAAYDVGVTGLALLAFVGAGYTHTDTKNGAIAQTIQRAVGALISRQEHSGATAGRISQGGESWVYDHAIATLALAELLMLSGDEETLKPAVTEAAKLCLKAQNPGSGWRYGIQPRENDSSVTGWMVLALHACKHAGLGIPRKEFDEAFRGALTWFGRVTAPNGRTGYFAKGDDGSMLVAFADKYPFDKARIQSMTALSTLSRLLSGAKHKDPALASSMRLLAECPPEWIERTFGQLSTINFYYWFHGTHALFQQGGPEWKSWNKSMTAALVKTQRIDGDEKGSWDPIDDWGSVAGRVYSTALGALTLEVYYRYPRAKEGAGL